MSGDFRSTTAASPFTAVGSSATWSTASLPRSHAVNRGPAARSFVLDQCGYTDADFDMVRRLGERLANAEVIMTIAVDALLNFSTPDNILQRWHSIRLPDQQVGPLLRDANEDQFKAILQRALPHLALWSTGFRWFTPFFIRPAGSRRALWFVHLSRHQKARDVMLSCHWNNRNAFIHCGESFGPNMLGWDALTRAQMPLLTFKDADREDMRARIGEDLMPKLHDLLTDRPQPYVNILGHYGNRTAATHSDMNDILIESLRRGDIEVRTADGKLRDRARLRHIQPDDFLALPRQLSLVIPALLRRTSPKKSSG